MECEGKIYVIGGNTGDEVNVVEEYDPATNSWATKAPMAYGRDNLACGVVNEKIFAIGGYYDESTLDVVEEYDPTTDSWVTKYQCSLQEIL